MAPPTKRSRNRELRHPACLAKKLKGALQDTGASSNAAKQSSSPNLEVRVGFEDTAHLRQALWEMARHPGDGSQHASTCVGIVCYASSKGEGANGVTEPVK